MRTPMAVVAAASLPHCQSVWLLYVCTEYRLSPVLRPVFEWNHRWAMARGEESLQAELRRRHTARPPSA